MHPPWFAVDVWQKRMFPVNPHPQNLGGAISPLGVSEIPGFTVFSGGHPQNLGEIVTP